MRVGGFSVEVGMDFTFREMHAEVKKGCVRVAIKRVRFKGRKAHSGCEFDSSMDTVEESEERV